MTSPYRGHDPQTPAGAETALQAFSDALDEAREALSDARDGEVNALAAYKAAKRRMLLSPQCPKVRRGRDGEPSVTVAERDAWVEDQCADEELAWMLARTGRQAAGEKLTDVPGITLPEPSAPSPHVDLDDNAAEAIGDAWRRGLIPADDLLALPGGES